MGKLQTKIGLVALLSKFKFEFVDQKEMKKEMEFDPDQFILTPKFNVMLTARVR